MCVTCTMYNNGVHQQTTKGSSTRNNTKKPRYFSYDVSGGINVIHGYQNRLNDCEISLKKIGSGVSEIFFASAQRKYNRPI